MTSNNTSLLSTANDLKGVCGYYKGNKATEDIYKGYLDLIRLIAHLYEMKNNSIFPVDEIKEMNRIIFAEFSSVIYDLENHFEAFPDETIQTHIADGKRIIKDFI